MIRALILLSLAVMLAACASINPAPHGLSGLWTLSIRDLQHKEMAVLTVQFRDEPGQSCMSGDWKSVVVRSAKASDKNFFPVSDPLTYMTEGSTLIIGRNNICDGYLHLRGKLDGEVAEGTYYSFGLGGGTDLGEFSLKRIH